MLLSLFFLVDITPTRNKFYVPQSDGCGSLGMKISTEYLPAVEMEQCCNAHDICYDTCNSDKELCDLDFKRCLYRYCDDYEKNVVGDIVVKGKTEFTRTQHSARLSKIAYLFGAATAKPLGLPQKCPKSLTVSHLRLPT